jgi:hypothetical protein
MLDLQQTLALQQSRRVIRELFEESVPQLEVSRTAGESKMKPSRFQFFWQLPKIKRAKVQTRATVR